MSFPVPGLFGLIDNPLLYPVFSYNNGGHPNLPHNDFLLMDFEMFDLMLGGNFLLMET